MPVLRQKMVYREDLEQNPDVLYLFGDNDDRTGYGGQAKEMRGEENAVGVRTKRAPGRKAQDYFSDDDYDEVVEMIDDDLARVKEHLAAGGIVVIPMDGLGTGRAQLDTHAPLICMYLDGQLAALEEIEAES